MQGIRFIYQSGAVGFGKGWWWHQFFPKFPEFPYVTKTVTLHPNKGRPWAVLPIGRTVFNKLGLPNPGFFEFLKIACLSPRSTVSISGTDEEIAYMVSILDQYDLGGIELNYTCPNVCNHRNKIIPKTRHNIYLKLNYLNDPYSFELDNVSGIRLNTIPCSLGGGSGSYAKEKNFTFIRKFINEGLPITGASFTNRQDLRELIDIGCKEIGIGCVMIVNPLLVLALENEFQLASD